MSIEGKRLTGFAPPPPGAVVTIVGFMAVAIYGFPTMGDLDTTVFTHRVFPDLISTSALLSLRLLFAVACFVGFITAWTTPALVCVIPYRPQSNCPRIEISVDGWRKQLFFTSWCWNVLGISFFLSAYIGYRADQGQAVAPWLVRLGLLLWELAAPTAFLVAAVVKYALWPVGGAEHFRTPRALLQHNVNAIMVAMEVALMGGLPMKFSHVSVGVLYGCIYVLFSWAYQLQWHGKGPAFVYFFMDTTLGTEHTIALYALLFVLMIFHGLLCGFEFLLELVGSNLFSHTACAVGLCVLVCKFHD